MKYLKVFETETLQDEFRESGDYLQPHVSCLEDGSKVKYNLYSKEYYKMLNVPFTIEATEDGTTIYFRQSSYAVDDGIDPLNVEVSTDNGTTWTEITASPAENDVPGATLAELDEGDKVLIRGRNEAYGYYSESEGYEVIENCNFWADKPCYIYGNIMSLIGGDDFARLRKVEECALAFFFSDYDGVFDWSWVLSKEGEKLLLPATTLADSCYYNMFRACTSLTTAPELPATTLADSCYVSMFHGCSSLTTVPELPAMTLTNNCYYSMFNGCTSLTSAPELPATTLANNCYCNMFGSCTSLIVAPKLPATTLERHCYHGMFNACTGLTSTPELPATTLAEACYSFMFYNCSSLTSAPELPAITLINDCYNAMFYGCTKLSYIKAMFTTTPSDLYTSNWVKNVNATGTFVKNYDANWNVTGDNGIPTGWTVETHFDGIPQ